jgi:hypothetical protein
MRFSVLIQAERVEPVRKMGLQEHCHETSRFECGIRAKAIAK